MGSPGTAVLVLDEARKCVELFANVMRDADTPFVLASQCSLHEAELAFTPGGGVPGQDCEAVQ
jgi:hypothetical protein